MPQPHTQGCIGNARSLNNRMPFSKNMPNRRMPQFLFQLDHAPKLDGPPGKVKN